METNQYNAQTKISIDRKSLQTIYFSFIRPLLEYADVVWNNCTQYESNELDKIQNEAARIVTGATKLASLDSLHTETGWETLGSRRKPHKLTMFYKMKNGLCPDYLVFLVPATVGASTYPLRSSSDLQTLHTNSRLYFTSFLPSAVHIIYQNTCMFTIDWFNDYSASWVHRGNDHTPPPELIMSKPRGDNKDNCNL